MGDEWSADYASYEVADLEEVADVEEVLVESARTLCWKEGREYCHVGWVRFQEGECIFQVYRDKNGASIITVEQNVCDQCVRRVRDLTRARGYELVDCRRDWQGNIREACDEQSDDNAVTAEWA